MNNKGQLSFEFIIILTIILLYINTIIQPTAIISQGLAKETMELGQLTLSAQKLANTIDFTQLSGGQATQTITIFVPPDGTLYCNSKDHAENPKKNTIGIKFKMAYEIKSMQGCQPDSSTPPVYSCEKTFKLESGAEIDCTNFGQGITSAGIIKAQVKKTNSTEPIKVCINSCS